MPRKYQQFPFEDIGLGLDTYSPKDKIKPGALSDALNIDAESNGTISARTGYERYYGNFPFKAVGEIVEDGTELKFTIGDAAAVDLTTQGIGPIYIDGLIKQTTDNPPQEIPYSFWTTYYFKLTTPFPNDDDTVTIPDVKAAYGYADTGDAAFAVFKKTNEGEVGNTRIAPYTILDDGTDLKIEYEPEQEDFDAFIYPLRTKDFASNEHKVVALTTLTDEGDGFYSTVIDISDLSSLSLIVECYEQKNEGDAYSLVNPYSAKIDVIESKLSLEFELPSIPNEMKVFIFCADVNSEINEANVEATEDYPGEFVINASNYPDIKLDRPFNFVSAWMSGNEGKLEHIDVAYTRFRINEKGEREIIVGYILPSAAESVKIVWIPCFFVGNEIYTTNPLESATYPKFETPIIWGWDHNISYLSGYESAANIVHIDNYRQGGEDERLIASQQGILFQASPFQIEASSITGKARVSKIVKLAPLFTSKANGRDRGEIISSDVRGNFIAIKEITADKKVAVQLKEDTIDWQNPPAVVDAEYDYIVFSNCAYPQNNGRYLITGIEWDEENYTVSFTFDNPNAKTQKGAGLVNVFSNPIHFSAASDFAIGDIISATALNTELDTVAINPDEKLVYVCGCVREIQFAIGSTVFIKRTSNILPLTSVTGIVKGDMLDIEGVARKFRAKQVATFASFSTSVTVSNGIATITTEKRHGLNVGDTLFLYNSKEAELSKEKILTTGTNSNLLVFEADLGDGTYDTNVLGKCVELDETITYVTDPSLTAVNVDGRWTPVKAPITREQGREPKKKITFFDELNLYSQPAIQSSVVNNSMYLANGADETKKYDGASVYNAGLPPFQPWCFLSVDTGGGALAGGTTTAFSAIDVSFDKGYFVVDSSSFSTNDRIKVSTTDQLLTVSDVQPFGTGRYKVFVEEEIDNSLRTRPVIGEGTEESPYIEQLSGITSNSFSPPVEYTLLKTDGTTPKITVSAVRQAKDSELELSFVKIDGRSVELNQADREGIAYQPFQKENSGLVIAYDVPAGSVASWKGNTVLNDITKIEFDANVLYTLSSLSEDTANYTISTSQNNVVSKLNEIKFRGVQHELDGDPIRIVPDSYVKGKNKNSSLVCQGLNITPFVFDTDSFNYSIPREILIADLPDTSLSLYFTDLSNNTLAIPNYGGIYSNRIPISFISSAPTWSAFLDFYLNDVALNIPDFLNYLSRDRTPSNFKNTLPLVEIKLPYQTNLASIKVNFTHFGGNAEIYNLSTSSWDVIEDGDFLNLETLSSDYVDTVNDNEILVSAASVDGTERHAVKFKILEAAADEVFFVKTTQAKIAYGDTKISSGDSRYIITTDTNFKVRQKDTLTEYYDKDNYDSATSFTFEVDSSVDRSELISEFSFIGLTAKVDGVSQVSGITVNDISDLVKLVISNSNTAKTREYFLSFAAASTDTEKEIKDIYIGKNKAIYNSGESRWEINLPYNYPIRSTTANIIFTGTKIQVQNGSEWVDFESESTLLDFGENAIIGLRLYDAVGNFDTITVAALIKDLKLGLSTEDGFSEGYYTSSSAISVDIPFNEDITSLVATFDVEGEDGELISGSSYRYYAKYSLLDRNENLISSAMLGSDDMYAEVFDASNVQLKLFSLPAYSELDYSRIDFELYRTVANSVAPFYRVYTSALEYGVNTGYINITDNITDLSLTGDDEDTITVNLLGGELGTRLERPPVGKVVTSADNRLVIGNITSPHIADVTIRKNGNVSELVLTDFDGMTIDIEGETTLNLVIDKDETFTSTILANGVFSHPPEISAGQWVYVFTATPGENKDLSVVGWYKTTAANTIPVEGDGGTIYSFCYAQDKIPVYIGTDGNINQRNFYKLPLETQVSTKISLAVNAVMAQADSANAWLLAQGGQSFPNGQFRLRQVANPDGQITITPTYTSTNFKVYVNNLLVSTTTAAFSSRKRFPSRLAVSYRNFSEIFDDCYRTDDLISSIIDVNPADGQEITAAVPFFGASAFGAAQLSQALVVFKTNSVYLVDIASNNVQKLQTQGQGCTAPKSVAVTKNGIFFANESGVYRLGTDMKVMWLGKALDGVWRNDLEKTNISLLAGHNYAQERRYKLSYPVKGEIDNSRVAVYDSARESLGQVGSWTVYDNHPALGWCNQTADSFFASTEGRVYKVRNRGEASDYRDDDKGIPLSFTFGATNFDMPDERKITESVTVQFQNEYGTVSNVKVLTEQSLSGIFNDSGTVTIPAGDTDATIRFSLPQRKGTHVRTRIEKDATVDEGFQISSLTYGVRTTGSDGVPQSRKFRS